MPALKIKDKNGNWVTVNVLKGVTDQTYNPKSENAQSGKAVAEALENCASVIKNTKSGSIVTMNDVSPVEHSLGVKISGKNLISYPYTYTTITIAGVTYTDNGDGTITVSGTATGYSEYLFNTVRIEPNTQYCFSGFESATNIVGIAKLQDVSGNDVALLTADPVYEGQKNIKFNTADYPQATQVTLAIKRNGNREVSGIIKPQLELGTTATEYAPYVDVSTVKVSRYGKNLFDKSKVTIGKCVKNTDGTLSTPSAGDKYCATDFIPVIPNATYICSGFSSHDDLIRQFAYYDKDKNFVSGGSSSVFVNTIPENAFYMRRNFFTEDIDKIQIEVGSVVTEYEAYKEPQTVTSNEDVIVTGLKSISPNMTLLTDTNGVIINTTYNVDTKTYIDRKFAELSQALLNL